MDYIHNKPDIPENIATEEFVAASVQDKAEKVHTHNAEEVQNLETTINAEIDKKLPAVTLADAGKFLRVSENGEWVAETIQSTKEVAF